MKYPKHGLSKKAEQAVHREAAARAEAAAQASTGKAELVTANGVSWRIGGSGTRQLRIRSVRAPEKHFIDLSIEEVAHPEDASTGRYVTRQTFFTADGGLAEAVVEAVAPGHAELVKAASKAFLELSQIAWLNPGKVNEARMLSDLRAALVKAAAGTKP